MKKTILSAMAAVALILGGYVSAFAEEPCNSNTQCTTSSCQAQEGFQTIGTGAEQAAEGSYNVVKEGTVNTYEKAKEGTVKAYEKTANGVEKGYNVVKEGTVNTYEKAKEGTVNLWNEAKEKIHEATE